MNNNRGNSRRRGRGGNRQQGHQQLNRIDSRARGNAPQLLEKYKKLAHDSHLNGDRVQEEYYLQFADHYFRVIADQKQRQEESRQRRDERSPDNPESGRDEDDRRIAIEDGDDEERRQGDGAVHDDSGEDRESDERQLYEPAQNPFVRESRPSRGTRQRKPRRSARGDDDAVAAQDDSDQLASPAGVDPSVLPPAISAKPDDDEGGDTAKSADAAEAKPRRRTRRNRPEDDTGEALQAVN